MVLAICVPKVIKFGRHLTNFRKNNLGHFLAHPVYFLSNSGRPNVAGPGKLPPPILDGPEN